MIYLNQIKDTRYLIKIDLNENLSFELKITVLFKYFNVGKNKIPFVIEDENLKSIMINGNKQSIFPVNCSDFFLATKLLNNGSDNIIHLTYLGTLESDSIIFSNSLKNLNVKFLKDNFIMLQLPHFNYYTSIFKYRLIATIPSMCKLFYKDNPFDRILHNGKRILSYESKSRSLRKRLNFIIKPQKKTKVENGMH
tara:strand:+ start:736 stop:1320 length:585 start_codon:yes stop_codon:yes gene_type:complete